MKTTLVLSAWIAIAFAWLAASHADEIILTPKPGPAPHINGPKVYGCRPTHPLLYRIPATGKRPIRFTAQGLPDSLELDPATGIIRGTAPPRGEYLVALQAENRHGKSERTWKLVSGDLLALTPPMGWNHWYAHHTHITDPLVRQATDVMIASGMADVGYEYVSIDGCWQNASPDAKLNHDPSRVGTPRDAQGNILPGRFFPDMRGLVDYIHSKGLKAGIYTSPGPVDCAGFTGSYQHEAQDARQFAQWGFDLLKYDWCSYGQIAGHDHSLAALQKPYRLMGQLLRQQPRDIVYNICQYGRGNVWEWGAEVGGQSWRTAGDLGGETNRLFEVALEERRAPRLQPARQLERPGLPAEDRPRRTGPAQARPPRAHGAIRLHVALVPDGLALVFQRRHGAARRFRHQRALQFRGHRYRPGSPGAMRPRVPLSADTFLMVKDLEDHTKAVGLCNRGQTQQTIVAKWSDLGVEGKQAVRDLWRQRDLGVFEGQFSAAVDRRGVALLRIGPQ